MSGETNASEIWRLKHASWKGFGYTPCVVTGERTGLRIYVAGETDSERAGQRIVAMFDGLATLAYEHPHPKVWVGADKGYEHMLEILTRLTEQAGGRISRAMVDEALGRTPPAPPAAPAPLRSAGPISPTPKRWFLRR